MPTVNRYKQRRDPHGTLYYEHRAVAEMVVCRPLREGEVVHHENGRKDDNHPLNVAVFSSQRAHMLYEHFRQRERRGVSHLFTVEEWLELRGEYMLCLWRR